MRARLGRIVGGALVLGLFLLAASILHHEFQAYRFRDIEASLEQIPGRRVLLALAITLVNYLALTLYDVLALRFVGRAVGYRRTALASFIAYVFSYNVGLSVLGGSAIRYRLYSAWGLSGMEIAKVVAFCGLTMWVGFFALGGVVLVLEPLALPQTLHLPFASVRPLGVILLALAAAYFLLALWRKSPVRFRDWEFSLPSPSLALAQIAVAAADWALAAAVFQVLLPETAAVSYPQVLGVFLLGQVAGILSHVPGGLGVFETIVLLFLAEKVQAPTVLGVLVAYRVVYYLLPLGLATALLGSFEALERREALRRAVGTWASWSGQIAPAVLSLATFVGGVILLVSGATPAAHGRLAWLDRFLPLAVVEFSHFVGSLVGAGLLLLARGLQQRLDAAYVLTVALLATGIAASLLKGLDYEEAIALTVVLLAFLPCHRLFYRKASLFSRRFTATWLVAIGIILIGSVWLGVFSYKHVEYRADLWWQFALWESAPRFLRASVGAIGVSLLFAVATLLRPASPEPALPGAEEMENASRIVGRSGRTSAYLALLGDKAFLFSDRGNAFIMYAVERRSWIAMGDPVGPEEEKSELAWAFREMADLHGGWTVFYEVQAENLPLYLDLGLTLIKLGEEARVALDGFSLEGGARKSQRHLQRKLEKEGCGFEWVPAESVPTHLPELRAISDAWLRDKATREKGFSLGFFDEPYLKRTPVGLVRQQGKIVAFSNVWLGADKEEISLDLMRQLPEAPAGVMEYLFLQLMLWGKEQGYHWFNLGMAPLSGLEARPLAPFWNRLGAMLFRHGEHFYNFQGLRQYKEKFDPVWQPKYLASPGGLVLPRVLTNLATLISGGLRGVVAK